MPDNADDDTTESLFPDGEMLRKLYRVVLKIPVMVLITDAKGIIEFVNPKFSEVTGFEAAEAVGESLWTFQCPKTSVEACNELRNTVLAGEEWRGDMANWKKNDSLYWESVSISTIRNEAGEVAHLVVVKEDITQRKRTEEKLFESEERFMAFMDNSPAVAWMKDEGGRYVYVSRTYQERFAAPNDDWRGKTSFDVWPEESAWTLWQNDQEVLSSKRPIAMVEEVPSVGRESGWWWNFRFPFRDAVGRLHVGGIGIDITDQKRAEEALRESRTRYRNLFESIDQGFCIIEVIFEKDKPVDYRYLEVNPAFAKHTGFDSAQGKRVRELVPNHEQQWFERYGSVAVTGESARFQEKAKELNRWYDVYAFRIDQPEEHHVAVLFNDITYRKQAEEEQERLVADLARSNRELEQFAYVASHDLQEPLRMVSSYIQLLERKYRERLDEKAQTYISYAVDGVSRMQKLIKGLLDYSRISQGAEFGPVDANAAFTGALANLERAVKEARGEVTSDDLPTVQGDETQLTQLMQNLIGNALKYRRQGIPPRVHVSARREGKEWVFAIRDNGIGIDSQHRNRVFQIFQRLHTRDEYPGTGIGLASCKKIVERHHGRIWVESEPGEGSVFQFTLPADGASTKTSG